jgi:hypothetical protein
MAVMSNMTETQMARPVPRAWLLACGLAPLAACGGNTEVVSFDLGMVVTSDLTMAPLVDTAFVAPEFDLAAAPGYPPGPYGTAVGNVVPNFTFQGYWAPGQVTGLASAEPISTVTFDRIRTSGKRYALIELAAFW